MSLDILYYGVMGLSIVLFFLTGTVLIYKARKMNQNNLSFLGVGFLLMILLFLLIGFLEGDVLGISKWAYIQTLNFIVLLVILLFVEKTFYKDQKSPLIYFVLIVTTCFIVILGYQFLKDFSNFEGTDLLDLLAQFIEIVWSFATFGWLGYASLKSYNTLKDENIEPWISKRIYLVSFSAFIEMFYPVPEFIRVFFKIPLADTTDIVSMVLWYSIVVIILIFILIQFFAWIMPSWFKNYLNRGYVPPEEKLEELSEEEIMKQLEE